MFKKLKQKIQDDISDEPESNSVPSSPFPVVSTTDEICNKSEQNRRLEKKISEFASIIKEKNKLIERLENDILVQKSDFVKRIQNLEEEANKCKNEAAESMLNNEHNFEEQMTELIKTKLNTESKFLESISTTEASLQQRDEDFGKLRHILQKTKQELDDTQAHVLQETEKTLINESKINKLTTELSNLQDELFNLRNFKEQLEKEDGEKNIKLADILRQNEKLTASLNSCQNQLSQKITQLAHSQEDFSKLQDDHLTSQKSNELHRNKMTQLLGDKDEQLSQLHEKIDSLDNRLASCKKSEEEQLEDALKENKTLFSKLEETRQQLSQVKSSWSDKISHLENQIEHLNNKIAEDQLDIKSCVFRINQLREEHEKKEKELLDENESVKQIMDKNSGIMQEKENLLEEQKKEIQKDLMYSRFKLADTEAEFKTELANYKREIKKLKEGADEETINLNSRINSLENELQQWQDKEVMWERQINRFEEEQQKLKVELLEKTKELSKLKFHFDLKEEQLVTKSDMLAALESELRKLKDEHKQLDKFHANANAQISFLTDENEKMKKKAKILINEDELSKLKKTNENLDNKIKSKDVIIAGLEASIQEIQNEAIAHSLKISQLEDEKKLARIELESSEVEQLSDKIAKFEEQIIEKNKTIKTQQQRLTTLKKTLQKELKVQSLPNEFVNDDLHIDNGHASFTSNHSSNLSPYIPSDTSSLMKASSLSSLNHYSSQTLEKLNTTSALLNYSRTSPLCNKCGCLRKKGIDDLDAVDFQYLKHVIMKFILSQDSESLKLVKAVSTLLKMSPDEHNLLHATLSYKASWFGSRPSLGKGQTSKIIPPSY